MVRGILGQCKFTSRIGPVLILWLSGLLGAADASNAIQFQDVAAETGIRFRHTDGSSGKHYIVEYVTAGLALFDFDSDGDIDIYFLNGAPLKGTVVKPPPTNALYRNDGAWRFTDVTEQAGVGDTGHGLGVVVGDYDNDGDPDLYLNNYGLNVLYRNNGDGTFTDITAESGIGDHAGPGMGTVCCDYDDDGDTDIFVGNDVEANFLFRNDGAGHFDEVALLAGLAYDFGGLEHGSMGAECADFDNDGLLDFHVTSYQQEMATLYRNLGDGLFQDVTLQTGAGAGTRHYVTWGNVLADFDNDGDRDLFICCGDLDDNVEHFEDLAEYSARNLMLMNSGDGRFANVSDQAGDGLKAKWSSRGAGFDDLDDDGDIDAVILNSRQAPTILRNDTINGNHWLNIRLHGVRSNRDGVGARVKVIAGGLKQVAEVHSGRGYQSHFGTRLHFGFASSGKVDRIEVQWIGGGRDVIEDVAVDQSITIRQGQSQASEKR